MEEIDIIDPASDIEPLIESVCDPRALRDDLIDPPFTQSLDFFRRDFLEPSWRISEDSLDLREVLGFPLEIKDPRRDRSFVGEPNLFERSLDDFGSPGASRDLVESACKHPHYIFSSSSFYTLITFF